MIQKESTEKIIVVRPGVAVVNSGDRLYNPTTSVFNQGVGGFGAYIDVAGSGNPAAMTPGSYAGQPFRFIQVRDTSRDKNPLPKRVLEQSQYIHGHCSFGLEIAGQPYSSSKNNSWLLGAPNAGTSGKINVISENTYKLNVSSRGYRDDLYNSMYNTLTTTGRFESQVWSDTVYSTENNRRDYTIKQLVRDFNRKNGGKRYNQLAFAVAIDTAGTTTTGPTIASVIAGGAGSTITIGYDGRDCTPVTLLVDEARLQVFTDLEAYLTGTLSIGAGVAKIALYAFSDTGCGGAIELGGDGNATADMILVTAIDEQEAYYDEIYATKRSITVGLDEGTGLPTVNKALISSAKELHGSARSLKLDYNNEEHYRSYTSSREWGANHVAYPDEILSGEVYDIYTIESCHNRSATSGMPSYAPHRVQIALVHTERSAPTSTFSTGAVNPQKTYLEAVLNAVAAHYNLATINI
jgi:hypothetical protein